MDLGLDCAKKCQANSFVGDLQVIAADRAFDNDWWQLCPNLAWFTRQLLDEYNLGTMDNSPSPESAVSPVESQISFRRDSKAEGVSLPGRLRVESVWTQSPHQSREQY